MAATTTSPDTPASKSTALGKGVGSGKRVSREDRGLPPLTKAQTIAKQNVQGAENACKFIKASIDEGNMPSSAVLQACSTLTGALAGMLGVD